MKEPTIFGKEALQVGCIYYNLDHPSASTEMMEAASVWKYKLALSEMLGSVRTHLEDRNGKKINYKIIDALMEELVTEMEGTLGGLSIE